jgi:hypothetical protein
MARDLADYNAYCQFPGNNTVSFEDGIVLGVVSSGGTNVGLVELLKFDPVGDLSSRLIIDADITIDDHSNPALFKLDGSFFLSGHTGHDTDSKIRIILLNDQSDGIEIVESWEVILPTRASYVDFSLRTGNRVLVVTRCMNWRPTAFWFDYESGLAGEPFTLFPLELASDDEFKAGRDRQRPYLLLRNENGRTYFTLTEDHPRNFRNGILAGYITEQGVFSLNDVLCATLGEQNWSPTECLTLILMPGQLEIPWVWDIAIYDGLVSIAYSWTSRDPAKFKSITETSADYGGYRVARYQQGQINYFDLGRADSSFCARESDYVGGISLHPEDNTLCAISTSFDPSDWNSSPEKNQSIYLCRYGENSKRFSKLILGPIDTYFRPRYVRNSAGIHQMTFMKGQYSHWTDFKTEVQLVQFHQNTQCFTHKDGQHSDLTFGLGKESDSLSPIPAIFEEFIPQSSSFFEWGAGQSTLIAIRANTLKITSVDMDFDLLSVLDGIAAENSVSFKSYAVLYDRYTVMEWSFLRDKSHLAMAAMEYVSPFSLHTDSDLILIDGRFRLYSFYQVVSQINSEATVIWDDYLGRPWYHSVEEFIRPDRFIGRAAVFNLTKQIKIPRTLMNAAAMDQR